MAGNPPPPPPAGNSLYAAVDMGTNSFKLLIVHYHRPRHRFLPLLRLKSPVLLPLPSSHPRALSALRHFHLLLSSHHLSPSSARHVATSAVRESPTQSHFLSSIRHSLGVEVEVLSGDDEARLSYLGVLHFLPIYNKKALIIDIGGGSTEIIIGNKGSVLVGGSVRLGHVTLTEEFITRGNEISLMRDHIRNAFTRSDFVEKIRECTYEVAIGSSGTIRAIEEAIYNGEGSGLRFYDQGYKRNWTFSKGELSELVRKLENGEVERERVFKGRSEFILAGAVLLEEIFGILRIEEMVVSGYSLGEGVIAEKLADEIKDYSFDVDARWQSVVRLASRLNGKKKMRSAALCAGIAKEMFDSIREWNEVGAVLDDKDVEYLEAACLLHGIGLVIGKRGYHKQSYHIIMDGGHLQGYDSKELKIIALLAKRHRKKFPKLDHHSLEGFTKEVKQKFRILCAILRVSIVVQQYLSVNLQDTKVSHSQEGFKLVLSEASDHSSVTANAQPFSEDADREITKELEHFEVVLRQKLTLIVPSSHKESLGG